MKCLLILVTLLHIVWTVDIKDGTKHLLLSQAIWRHGDRSPIKTYNSDPYREDAWKFGGSGWGQLSPLGMQQHLNLGQMIRKRYVDVMYPGFLSNYYDSHEIYVRSTDVNRTIISALSNMIGMYGQASYNNRPGTDSPLNNNTNAGAPIWPPGYVPIAVHTVDDDTDFIGNADAICPRQDQLWAMAKSSAEVTAFVNSSDVSTLLQNLTIWCNQSIDIDNLWVVADSFLIEQIWQPDFLQKVKWYSDSLNNLTVVTNDQVYLYQNGVYNQTLMMNGLDIGIELQKIRGGSITNDILMHANLKFDCWNRNDTSDKCTWINKLKYYVYSAHDETVYAFFTCLGIQSKAVTPHGYPKYSAATLFELWYDEADGLPYFRLLYHDQDGDEFYSITEDIPECNNQTYCDLSVYTNYAQRVKPDQPMAQWCLVDPRTRNQAATTPQTTQPQNPTTPKTASATFFCTGLVFVLILHFFKN